MRGKPVPKLFLLVAHRRPGTAACCRLSDESRNETENGHESDVPSVHVASASGDERAALALRDPLRAGTATMKSRRLLSQTPRALMNARRVVYGQISGGRRNTDCVMRPLLVFLILFAPLLTEARSRAVRHPSGPDIPRSVMWIAAHPDDEAVAAPLLAKWCLDEGARCSFVILTRGESGPCLRTGGCAPDLASVRSAEAGSAAELFHADSFLLRLPDGGGVAAPSWSLVDGNRPDIVITLAALIEAERPELVLTFDPRHGTTCHPDHRETGRLVLEAAKRISFTPRLYLLETFLQFSPLTFASATPAAEKFDATQPLITTGEPAWNAVVLDMRRHASQFDDAWIAAVQAVPAGQQAVFFAPAATTLDRDLHPCE
jgi:LmbE family N-acetylglucosaminyl deacetylase